MYVLCSACILHPELRAEGITRPSDLALFQHAVERCKKFGIEMVPLPCPETLYLGPDRKPGTYVERLNTAEFSGLMDRLEREVTSAIRQRGPPLCIIGVNSSPTCGVTSTWYGAENDRPPKREGRGVFLAKFSAIPAVDVAVFARYRVYLAAPLFSEAERHYNLSLANLLRKNLFDVYLPQDASDDTAKRGLGEHRRLFSVNRDTLAVSDAVVAVIDGADADSGTAWEMGYAYAKEIPVIAVRTDFRHVGAGERVNLMLEQSSVVVTTEKQLLEALNAPLCLRSDR